VLNMAVSQSAEILGSGPLRLAKTGTIMIHFTAYKGNWTMLWCLLCFVVKSFAFVQVVSSVPSSVQFRILTLFYLFIVLK